MTTLPAGARVSVGRDLNGAPAVRLDLDALLPNKTAAPVSVVATPSEMRALGYRLIEEADLLEQAARPGLLFGVRG